MFTTQEVLDGAPILFVYHDEDGDWQFYNIPTPAEADVRMVCLEDIVKRDPSVNAVHDLRYGWQAWRTDKESDWELDQ